MKTGSLLLASVFAVLEAASAQDMPRCVVRSGEAGAPAILVDGQVYAPIFFAANNQFGRDDVLFQELRLAANADIPFFSFNLALPWRSSKDDIRGVMDAFCGACPKGYFYLRIGLGAPAEWLQQHPDECITTADGERLDMASPSSEIWREAVADQLRQLVELIAQGPHAERFVGLMFAYLQTGEWFYPRTEEFMDYSPANLVAFRKWLRQRYRRDKALRQAWNDPRVSLDTVAFATPEQREAAAWGIFRDPLKHRACMDMQWFQSEMMADAIIHFGRAVKEASKGRVLTGAFYGYTFELNHNGPRALAHSGHLAFGRLLASDAIDLIHAPYSYFERGVGEPGHFHLPVDSVALHGKLAIMEEDTYTHLSQPPPEGVVAPGWERRTQSMEETLAVTRRNYGNFLMHRCGFWFFDLLSDGRWNDPVFWQSTGLARRVAAELRGAPPFRPEVAFVVDEEAVAYLTDNTHPVLLCSLGLQRHELGLLGAPVGYYLTCDTARLPETVRLLVFPNAYTLDRAAQEAANEVLKRGGAVVWVYAPGIMGPAGPDVTRVGAATGFAVEARLDGTPQELILENNQEQIKLIENTHIPRLIILNPDVQRLAAYTPSGETAIAARREGPGTVIYCAVPQVPLAVLRFALEQGGGHRYRETPGHVAVAGSFVFVHGGEGTNESRSTVLVWPQFLDAVTRLAPPARFPLSCEEGHKWRDVIPERGTAVYRCE